MHLSPYIANPTLHVTNSVSVVYGKKKAVGLLQSTLSHKWVSKLIVGGSTSSIESHINMKAKFTSRGKQAIYIYIYIHIHTYIIYMYYYLFWIGQCKCLGNCAWEQIRTLFASQIWKTWCEKVLRVVWSEGETSCLRGRSYCQIVFKTDWDWIIIIA